MPLGLSYTLFTLVLSISALVVLALRVLVPLDTEVHGFRAPGYDISPTMMRTSLMPSVWQA